MRETELCALLESLGMPVAYSGFVEKTSPPFITYHYIDDSDLKADNVNYCEIGNYQIVLYTTKKDLVKEKMVQDLLKLHKIPYSKRQYYITSEELLQTIYEIQLIGG